MMNASYNNVNILIRDACDTGILSHTMFRLRVVVSGRRPTKNGHGMVSKNHSLDKEHSSMVGSYNGKHQNDINTKMK